MKKITGITSLLMAAVTAFSLVGCSSSKPAANDKQPAKKIVVGVSQIGAETEWRIAMTNNMKAAFDKAQFELKFSDGQLKQENQIKAVRAFIQQKVDVIVLAPVVQTGWDSVLKEALDAKIPVILANRGITVASGNKEDLYVTFLGPDNTVAGKNSADFLVNTFKDRKDDVNIVELQGVVGSSSATERKIGFDTYMKDHPTFKTIKSQAGDNTRAKGKEIMEAILKSVKAEGKKIDALYSHSDDMAIGAAQAMEEAGIKPGKDIVIVSVDGVKGSFEAMVAGKHNATNENPIDYGTPLVEMINKIVAGKGQDIKKRTVMPYLIWTAAQAAAELPNRKY